MKKTLATLATFILALMLGISLALATIAIGSRAAPARPPASVPTQKVEPETESAPSKPFNLGRYRVENLA